MLDIIAAATVSMADNTVITTWYSDMTIYEIRVIAQNMAIDPKKKNKIDLIKSIQIKERNKPCFRATGSYCDQTDCCWRSDCLK